MSATQYNVLRVSGSATLSKFATMNPHSKSNPDKIQMVLLVILVNCMCGLLQSSIQMNIDNDFLIISIREGCGERRSGCVVARPG